jgi:hypothetical protein
VTEVEHFLPREQIFANICSLGSFHFFDSCDKNLMGVLFIYIFVQLKKIVPSLLSKYIWTSVVLDGFPCQQELIVIGKDIIKMIL